MSPNMCTKKLVSAARTSSSPPSFSETFDASATPTPSLAALYLSPASKSSASVRSSSLPPSGSSSPPPKLFLIIRPNATAASTELVYCRRSSRLTTDRAVDRPRMRMRESRPAGLEEDPALESGSARAALSRLVDWSLALAWDLPNALLPSPSFLFFSSSVSQSFASALAISSRSSAKHSAALTTSELPPPTGTTLFFALLSMSGTVCRGSAMLSVLSSFSSRFTQSTSVRPGVLPSLPENCASTPTRYGVLAPRYRSMCGGTTVMRTCRHMSSPCARAELAALTHRLSRLVLRDMSTMRRSQSSAARRRTKCDGPMQRRRGMMGHATSSGRGPRGRHSNPGWSVTGR
mmetsp:Transcript_1980/g.4681  ORF Transcript_1980/g.4681 Transcript_1980/m.4681 type:complete len:348 (+) Transcript_1980:1633-2676(+)